MTLRFGERIAFRVDGATALGFVTQLATDSAWAEACILVAGTTKIRTFRLDPSMQKAPGELLVKENDWCNIENRLHGGGLF